MPQSDYYRGREIKTRTFWQSLRHARRGIMFGVWQEPNLKIQFVGFVFAIILGWWLKPAAWKVTIVLILCVVMMAVELINSSIEALADVLHPNFSVQVQRAKDMSAGGVLVIALITLIVGLVVYLPLLLERIVLLLD